MPVSIAMPNPKTQTTPLEKLASALDLAKGIYGIYATNKQQNLAEQKYQNEEQGPEKQAQDQAASQSMDLSNKLNDPTSAESQQKRSLLGAYVSSIKGSDAYKNNKTAFDGILQVASDPNTSGAQVDQIASSPLLSSINQATKANASLERGGEKAGGAGDKNERTMFKDTKAALEQMRGNPAVQQAEKDLYSAQKANSLFDQYPDLNKMPPAQVQLVASEVAKMAQGGSPTMTELQGLDPHTLSSGLAVLAGRAANDPQGAQAKEFLKQFKNYVDGIKADAQTATTDRYRRIINTARQDMSPEHVKVLEDNYLNRFNVGSQAPKAPAMSDEDKQAVDWAQKNPTDPRAAQILKLHGM